MANFQPDPAIFYKNGKKTFPVTLHLENILQNDFTDYLIHNYISENYNLILIECFPSLFVLLLFFYL